MNGVDSQGLLGVESEEMHTSGQICTPRHRQPWLLGRYPRKYARYARYGSRWTSFFFATETQATYLRIVSLPDYDALRRYFGFDHLRRVRME